MIGGTRPAGFWIRALAFVIDFAVFFAAQFSFGFLAGRLWGPAIESSPGFQLVVVFFTLAFTAAYTSVLHAMTGQTVGKMLVGVRVVGTDGELLPLGAAFLRWLGYWASAAMLGFGYVIAGLRRDKRALHDLLAGSRVERLGAERRPSAILSAPAAAAPRAGTTRPVTLRAPAPAPAPATPTNPFARPPGS